MRQLRFGCGASLQSGFVTQKRHWKEMVVAEDKSALLVNLDKRNKNGVSKG